MLTTPNGVAKSAHETMKPRGPLALVMDGLTKYSLGLTAGIVKYLLLLGFLGIFFKCSEHFSEWVEIQKVHARIAAEQHMIWMRRYAQVPVPSTTANGVDVIKSVSDTEAPKTVAPNLPPIPPAPPK